MTTKRLLVGNVYFAPRRFGGATIVAEQMALQLMRCHGWQVTVFTTIESRTLAPYAMRRYAWNGLDVIGIKLPEPATADLKYFNSRVNERFREVVELLQPDVAHMHCLQLLGSGLLDVLSEAGVPSALTLHDAWWLCERQFMLDRTGYYCFQKEISMDRCRYCVDDPKATIERTMRVRTSLSMADRLLFPSTFQQELYEANGCSSDICRVNKNGVKSPVDGLVKSQRAKAPVFGFVGGPGRLKGADLIIQAARQLERDDFVLKVVDAAQLLGESWADRAYWDVPGEVTFVDAYTYDTIDRFFSRIDILLCPSQWKESFGLTVREALLRDVWVIATDAGGMSEDLRQGENATVIPLEASAAELAKALAECMDRTDWPSYENPYKGDIVTIEGQADELDGYLEELI